MVERARRALFKLSNYCTYIEIGADPEFREKGIDWGTVVGGEYLLFAEVCQRVRILQNGTSPPSRGA